MLFLITESSESHGFQFAGRLLPNPRGEEESRCHNAATAAPAPTGTRTHANESGAAPTASPAVLCDAAKWDQKRDQTLQLQSACMTGRSAEI